MFSTSPYDRSDEICTWTFRCRVHDMWTFQQPYAFVRMKLSIAMSCFYPWMRQVKSFPYPVLLSPPLVKTKNGTSRDVESQLGWKSGRRRRRRRRTPQRVFFNHKKLLWLTNFADHTRKNWGHMAGLTRCGIILFPNVRTTSRHHLGEAATTLCSTMRTCTSYHIVSSRQGLFATARRCLKQIWSVLRVSMLSDRPRALELLQGDVPRGQGAAKQNVQSHAGKNIGQGFGSLVWKGHKSWKPGIMGFCPLQLCPLETAGICGVHYRHVLCKSDAGVIVEVATMERNLYPCT